MIIKVKGLVYLLPFIIVLVACKKESPESLTTTNEKPVAIAGPDQFISHDSVFLSGGNSYKNNGTITGYLWTKIYGPDTFNIKDPTAAKTFVNKLVQGVYGFELKVTDNTGLFARDTVEVTVIFPPPDFCNNSNRPQVNAQLVPVGTLSELRYGVAVASAGNKILFAGGIRNGDPFFSSRVDIYNITTQTWSTSELSLRRTGIAAIASGSKIFFAGGSNDGIGDCPDIDIYDVATNTWTFDSLSEGRSESAATAVGNKVFFAGGKITVGLAGDCSSKVDIYDLSTNTWTTTDLKVGRASMSAVTVNNKIYFAGGQEKFNDDPLNRIDIYDTGTNSWTESHLSEPKFGLAAIAVANKIYWAGGWNRSGHSCLVEIEDVNTNVISNTHLFKPGSWAAYASENAVMKDNKIVFPCHNSDNRFDIYDIATATWSIGMLPVNSFSGGSIISVNNTIYIAGAIVNGVLSNQVWKLEF